MLVRYEGNGQWIAQDGSLIGGLEQVDGVFRIDDDAKLNFADYGQHRQQILSQCNHSEAVTSSHPTHRLKLTKSILFKGADVVEDVAAPATIPDVDKLQNKNKYNSMLRLIQGMAMEAYGYDPENPKNTATGDKNGISAKIATKGISVSNDTIKNYLDEAKLLPKQGD